MHLTIDNHDYTAAALDASVPLTIERTLNAPSACRFLLALPADASPVRLARFQPVAVTGDDGTIYFTGYIAAAPRPEYAGLAPEGPQYRLAILAVSDEILLDQAVASSDRAASGLTAGALLASLAQRLGQSTLDISSLTLRTPVAHFTPKPGAPFSKSAGQIASLARAAYRAHAAKLTLNAIPSSVHTLDEGDGSLNPANLQFTHGTRREFANDITVCGEHEAATYVTELFIADGISNSFILTEAPYFPPASSDGLIMERFDGLCIDARHWSNPTGDSYFALGSSGLQIKGGSGIEGDAQLTWVDPVEMAGTLLLEAEGVKLASASTGLLAALFCGDESDAFCFAGFQANAQQGSGAVSLQPVVFGSACGPAFDVAGDNEYALRIRIHSPEQQSTLAVYLSLGDDGPVTRGGQSLPSPARIHFEIQEFVNGVASMPVVLYECALNNIPAACSVVAASSLNLHGSMRAISLTSLGSAWVVSKAANGSAFTRRMGSATQSAECAVERAGRLVFNTGFTPAAGELIAVFYRAIGRSAGRAVNTASQRLLASQGSPGTIAWIGSVTNPPARSSADCRNAAAAVAQSAASSAALWSGQWRGTNFEVGSDVWPGDALALNAPSCNLDAQLVVRSVKLTCRPAVPDLIDYEIAFANDWAEDLAIRTSDSVPSDVGLPVPAAPQYAANLNALTVTSIAGNTVTINTGTTAPTGGGFEIRSRDHGFMPGEDATLVMRGSQPNLTFTRRSAADRFYVRIFDSADPPNYSEFSAALVFNLPLTV